MDFSSLCTPAMIYFVTSFIFLLITSFTNFNIISVIVKGGFNILWTWFLNFLCSKGYTILSWIIVLLPVIIMVLL